MDKYSENWLADELALLKELNHPMKIQQYLDTIEYDSKTDTRSPRYVMIEKSAHCFEGAMFAAACLQNIGYKPLILDLRAVNDDDHVIAVFQKNNLWGSIAKSNFTTLRYREPVYKSLRELAMSYFDFYFNTAGQKTLREYSIPLNLSKYNHIDWKTTDADMEHIGDKLDRLKHYPLIGNEAASELSEVSPYLVEAGLMGSNPEGLFKPE
ncbi:MAG: hypothetical protein CVU00_15045 [Bacteroidetes bacterium HGW-Bacteroidetes-17]|nr:MAG: hypothetical protein CVU00_15045 [Bacteroidetes bacterium HGW-Bacteroidetes-17]